MLQLFDSVSTFLLPSNCIVTIIFYIFRVMAGLRGNSLGYTTLLTFAILSVAWFVGFASRLFAIIRFESIIHEFDPWYVSRLRFQYICR